MSTAADADQTLASLIQQRARLDPEGAALMSPGRPGLSFAALGRQVQQVADTLGAAGASRSSRIAIVLPNGPEMAAAFLAVASVSTCAPLNPAYRLEEFQFYLEDLKAGLLIVQKGLGQAARDAALPLGIAVLELEVDASLPAGEFRLSRLGAPASASGASAAAAPSARDIALILHTSGTTAKPKIVPLSHANLMASARHIADHLALTPADRCLNVMPLFHIHGLVGVLLASLAAGSGVVCAPGFSELSFFDWVEAFQPTWYSAVPTVHQSVVAQGARYRQAAPTHQFRFVRSSSAALPPKVFAALEALTGAPVIEAYGMTEASHQMASNPLPPRPRKPGSVGAATGIELAVMDEGGQLLPHGATGEIVIRGSSVISGYENNPEANAKAFTHGWFRTGDQGHLDGDGNLVISGRLKEIVNRGGEKISPREIDEMLLEHPAVLQAVAFAVPHPTLGEDLAAAVVLRAGEHADEAGLRDFLFQHLAEFKVPSSIVFIDDVPKGATGKVQRATLHEKLWRLASRAFVAPREGLEADIERIFRAVLQSPPIGVNDNFFALGGDSLKGIQVMNRIQERHGHRLPATALFRHPTIASLAAHIESLNTTPDEDRLAAEIAQLSDEEVARWLALEEARGNAPSTPR